MEPFDFELRTRLVFGAGTIGRLGPLARELGFRHPLLVADPGLVKAGHTDRAVHELDRAGIAVTTFHDFEVNPDTAMIERARDFAAPLGVDSIVGLGGGSSMDCAKGANFLLTNGGTMADYRGYGKASEPMLPMIAVPTTAGTGSEGQSYAVISDSTTHLKMACGDSKAAFRVAVLDPELTLSQPAPITAAAGFDAIAHAVETSVTTRRNPVSDCLSREAWRLLSANYARVMTHPDRLDAREAMQLGSFYAGLAIEQSMLGAAHACANPLTARYRTTHGMALAILLPHIVRWNSATSPQLYLPLLLALNHLPSDGNTGERLADWIVDLTTAAGLPSALRDVGVPEGDLPQLADDAGKQWTATFNPRPFGASDALEVYQCAY